MEHENPPFSLHTRGDRGGRASASPVIQYPFDFLREDETGMIIGPFRKQNSKLCHTMLHIVIFAFTIKWRRKASKLRGLEARVAALETKFNFLLQFMRRWTEREEEKKKATISKRQKEIYPALSLSKAAQTLPTPRRPAFHIPRPSRTEPRQVPATANPSPTTICLADQEEDDYARQPEDAYRATAQRLQQRPDLIEGVINTIGAEKDEEVDITSTRIPWEPLFHELKKRGLLPAPRAPKESTEAGTCQYHPGARDHNLQGCEEFKKEVAGLITKGLIRRRGEQPERDCMTIDQLRLSPYEKTNFQARMERIEEDFEKFSSVSAVQSSEKVPSVVIQVPQPFPYQDSKKIPWNYGMKKRQVLHSPEELEKRRKEAGKAVEDPVKTKAAEEEAADFLRIIKSSEYSIVKQLSKMPSHISVLSLLLASESHRKALLKVLNEAYVPEDITGPSFENMVTSILVTNQLTFSDDELPPEGRGHTKALYISVKTNDRVVSRVLIDNGSALNVCPLSTLEKLDIDPTRVRVNSMVVRAFDGTRREVLGEIDLPVEIGPQVYDINFQVLRIDSPYNLLLGRPWLHTAGAVPSSLHQKMKLIIGNQLIVQSWDHGSQGIRQGGVSAWARFRLCEPRKNHNCDPGGKQRQGMDWGIPRPEGIVRWPMKPGGKELQRSSKERNGLKRRIAIPHIRTTFPASAMFQVDEGDVDELALLFTEDLNVNAITTEGDSAAFPVHADQHEEIDLEDFLDEENLKGYRIDEETLDEDTWEDDDLPDLLPHLMVPRGLDTLEFEIFCEHGDPESHLRKVRGHLVLSAEESCLLGRFGESFPGPIPPQHQGTTTKPHHHHVAEEEDAGPMVEGLSIHTIAPRRRIPPPHHRPATANREKKSRRGLAYHCYSVSQVVMSKRITRKTSNDPHVSKIDNKTDCSLDNIDNSDEEIELPSDILEALERQDEGSKPNIEELEIVNLANEGEEPREVKIGTRCAAEQKEALIALLREFHEIFAWSYQDMPGLDTDIVVHKIPLKPECKPVKASTATDEARSHFEDQGRGGKAIEGRFPKHSNLFGLGSQYSPGAEEGRKTTNVVFSFMDGFSGYNQIKMAEEDKSKTAFVTHWGTFVYDVMPFGLKNAGATYQRAMVTLFHDMIHHEIEVYVDDMIAKSRTAQDHLTDLRKLFQRLKKYQLRLNPNKCAFGVTSGKLLGFIVSGRGIEIDPAKLTATCEPLFKLLRKDVKIKWTEDCQKAFDKIKEYLLNPPILVPPTPGRPLILYLTVQEASMGCMLGQQDETGKKEQAIYYLSKKFTEPETRYLLVEEDVLRTGLGLQEAETVHALLHHLVEFPDEDVMTVEEDNQGRWKLYFDGAANAVGSGIGAVLVSPKGQQTPIAVKLGFDCTNNMTEYEACIVGLQAALEFGAYELEVFGDSLLIVSQTNGEWQGPGSQAHPVYQRYISRLSPKVQVCHLHIHPKSSQSLSPDALATLASLIKLVEGDDVRPLRIETRDIPAYCVCIEECMNVEAEIDDKPWYYDIKRFIQDREYPSRATENEKKYIRRMAFQFLPERRDSVQSELMTPPLLAIHVQTCHKCQMYQNSKNAPPQYLHTMASPWPFSAWGMDVIGAITPKASNGHEFILVAIDYFTKWVEACSFKNVTQVAVTRYASSSRFQHHNSAPYRPKMNGAVEAANKNVKKILSKMTETYKDWHEHLPYALCAYRTWKKPNGPKPRYEQLNFIDEKRLAALCHGQLYQRRIERAYNKKARPRTFQPGDLVLKKRNMALSDPRGKFAPSYEGPYVVKKAFSGGAIILADMDGEEFRSPINSDSVIKYHV
uniref:RNase H type-1 domain-containing protein n=1 Tax=Fagus sylvatica TaxID=28930 RepID=A0A2N9H224_FAGSY